MKDEFNTLAKSVRSGKKRHAISLLSKSPSWGARLALASLFDEPEVGPTAAASILDHEDGYHFILKGLESDNATARRSCLKALDMKLPLVYSSLPGSARRKLHRTLLQLNSAGNQLAASILKFLPAPR